ncbi:endonuclease [Streptomyces sp. NPDC127098]|uniref:endonuclease n=1 Tax=Streptomyces sp. NPDC127098 TaxID=3347137 RepID=UPI00364BD879
MTKRTEKTAHAVIDTCGETYAEQAGIRLRNSPASLYQLLVLSHLLSARISSGVAVAAARALFDAGMRDARHMADATWQQRVDALGEGHYRRYDERTSTQLGDEANLLLERYGGDLRRLREEGDVAELLQQFPGIGPTGADIFLREAQAVWPEYAPRVDDRMRAGAERVGLPRSPGALSRLVSEEELPHLAAGLVRVSLNKGLADEVRAASHSTASSG